MVNRIKNHLDPKPESKEERTPLGRIVRHKKYTNLAIEIYKEGKDPTSSQKLIERLGGAEKAIRNEMQKAADLIDFFPLQKKWLRFLVAITETKKGIKVRRLGPTRVVVLAFLCNQAKRNKAEQNNNGWFYCTIQTMEEELGLTKRAQDLALRALIDTGYISISRRGMPALRYFRINWLLIKCMVEHLEKRANKIKRQISKGIG